ncbi:ABC transporter substrate-binding protein, partial [Bacillus sp. GbtcB15]|uniref:ABC transporter substrate-binding protein n=1 Tax=Bacillus sp. GbtcB15 TaxID=2824760 RepID=UPI0020C6F255
TMNNVMEGLYRLDPNQEVVEGMAEGDPEVSEDGTVYTFKLRDAKWSNGDPVTANDFVYAWQRAIDPANASPYGPYMMDGKIKGAAEISAAGAEKKEYDLNTLGVKALDEKTLEVTLERPIPYYQS